MHGLTPHAWRYITTEMLFCINPVNCFSMMHASLYLTFFRSPALKLHTIKLKCLELPMVFTINLGAWIGFYRPGKH